MRNSRAIVKQGLHGLWGGLQWVFAGFFVLCVIVSLGDAGYLSAAAFFFAVVLSVPPTRHLLMNLTQGKLTRKRGIIAICLLFMVGIWSAPQAVPQSEPEPVPEPPAPVVYNVAPIAPKKPAQIERIERVKGGWYDVVGYGPVDKTVYVQLANGKTYSVVTNGDGFFVAVLPKDTTPFGMIELLKDAENESDTYESLHEPYHYSFFATKPVLSSTVLRPIMTKVRKDGTKMKIEGFSEPNVDIVLMHKDAEIGNAKANADGYFAFRSIEKKEHFMQVTVLHSASRGLTRTSFIETTVYTLNTVLPRWTKKVTAKEAIAFGTREESDSTLAQGQTRVSQEGKEGVKTVYYLVTYVGAEEVARVVTKEDIVSPPVEKVVVVGTYIAPVSAPAPTYSFSSPSAPSSSYYANCSAARAAGVTPIYRGQPGYGTHLDRDNDGIACE